MILLKLSFICSTLSWPRYGSAYTAGPRWGQAVAVINDALYVHGGKTDDDNAYSYTSAPTNNDLLYLNLSSSFSASSPSWELIGGSQIAESSQGPSVAWHTLSGLNSSYSLLFGGSPGVNDDPVLITRADSSWLLDIEDPINPEWQQQDRTWAEQPVRRIHHSTVTVDSGHVFIFGGELADGSEQPLTDHYIFNPYEQTFSTLPTDNGPGDITGHASVILNNGTIVVLGGYSQSSNTLNPFSRIWMIDTGSMAQNVTWKHLDLESDEIPNPRRAFAATVIEEDKVLIHGGSDASYLNTYSDGWLLDLSVGGGRWSPIDALTELGPRRDHFAVSTGSSILFGFGYGSSGPVGNSNGEVFIVFNPSSDSIVSSYTPPSPTQLPTQTMPGATQTGGSTHDGGAGGVVNPTSTVGNGGPDDPNGDGNYGGDNTGDGDGGNTADGDDAKKNRSTAIAIGTAFGVLGALAAVVVMVWYVRRKKYGGHGERRFARLANIPENDEDSPHSPTFNGRLPVAGGYPEKDQAWPLFRSIGLAGAIQAFNTRRKPERRDILADEDTRVFPPAYNRNESTWSLRSILGAGRRISREPSTASSFRGSMRMAEKNDPFSDGASLLRDMESGTVGAAIPRPHGQRETSHASSLSTVSYVVVDPFADPTEAQEQRYGRHRDTGNTRGIEFALEDPPPPPTHLRTPSGLQLAPWSIDEHHVLSPVTESSRQSFGGPPPSPSSHSANSQSHETLSPFESSSRITSGTSYEARSPRPTSIIDPAPKPMRRSDSWWSRFSRTSFLDRRGSGTSMRSSHPLEFRDPNPPPRLIAIEESTHSAHTTSPESAERGSPGNKVSKRGGSMSRRGSRMYGAHGKSSSSLRTADSEAIERIAGTMDVMQRDTSGSNRTRDSTATSLDVDEDGYSPHDRTVSHSFMDDEEPLVVSPVDVAASGDHPLSVTFMVPPPPLPKRTPPPLLTGRPALSSTSSHGSSGKLSTPSSVAAKVQEFERKMSLNVTVSPPPTNTKKKEERPRNHSRVDYGLVPRASLFVANPDHRAGSGDT